MFDNIVSGLKPYYKVGFIDEINSAPDIGPDAIVVKAGNDTVLVNIQQSSIEVHHGDNKATVLSGITAPQAVRFIVQALGTKDFVVPVMLVSRFQASQYPGVFKDAVLAPVGITNGKKPGTFSTVFKDVRGRFYIHEDETRVTLKLYKELFDMNSEAEVLSLPKLFSSETPPPLLREFTMITESLANEVIAEAPIVSIEESAKAGIPLRVEGMSIPKTGYFKSAKGNFYSAEQLSKDLFDLAIAMDAARKGIVSAAPPVAVFSSLKASLGDVSETTDRAEVILEFQVPWAGDFNGSKGIFIDSKKIIMSRPEAATFFRKLDKTSGTSNEKLIIEMLAKSEKAEVVKPLEVTEIQSAQVTSFVVGQITKPTEKSFLVSSVVAGKAKEQELEAFIKESEIPAWLAGSASFAVVKLAQ